MNFGLTPEQEMVVSTVRSFVENELYPLEAEVEQTGRSRPRWAGDPRKVIALGFYAPKFRSSSAAAGSRPDLHAARARARAHLLWRWPCSGRPSNILWPATGEQRERYLLPAIRGEKIDALAMTEPDAGSDVRSMKTTARRDGGDWVIDGTKHFISHADVADFVIVFVATGRRRPGPARRSGSPASSSIAARRASRSGRATAASRTAATTTASSTSTAAACRTPRSWARRTAASS